MLNKWLNNGSTIMKKIIAFAGQKLPIILFASYLGLCVFISLKHPNYTWDILAYTGSVYSVEGNTPKQIHQKTYSLAKQYLTPAIYNSYIGGDATVESNREEEQTNFKANVYSDPDKFYKQLPLYYIKPLYVILLFCADQLGLNPMAAALLLSMFVSSCICILIYGWLSAYLSRWWALLWSIVLLSAAGINDLFSLPTPDIACGGLVLLAVYLYVQRKGWYSSIACLFTATFFRIDTALFILLFIAYEYVFRSRPIVWSKDGVCFALAMLLPMVVDQIVGAYSWSTLFYYNFVSHLDYPNLFRGSIAFKDYASAFILGLRLKSPCNIAITFIALALVSRLLPNYKQLSKERLSNSFRLVQGYIVVRFILFPLALPRFLFVDYLVMGVFFIRQIDVLIGGHPDLMLLVRYEIHKYSQAVPSLMHPSVLVGMKKVFHLPQQLYRK